MGVLAVATSWYGSVGGAVAAIILVISALGMAAALFKAQRAQATIKVLQDLTDALDKQNKNQQNQIDGQESTIAGQARQIVDLKEMVQSKAAVEQLAVQMATNHAEVIRLLQPRGT
jgi:uncharacterized protein HemX